MIKKYILITIATVLISLVLGIWLGKKNAKTTFPSTVKLALRNVGDQLLRAQHDTTSIVLPVIEKESNYFVLSFETPLSIHPDSLVNFTQKSFQKAKLPDTYLLELLACNSQEVAYSYAMKKNKDKAIVPCKGRILPKKCYRIEVQFSGLAYAKSIPMVWYYILLCTIAVLILALIRIKTTKNKPAVNPVGNYTTLGSFHFYPEQNKLVKQAEEISLSKKECELLSIFIEKPNQIVKREELSKKVWEDQGVIVGRSLDTYISKLRKKLKADTSIKLTNVHGVGYKLEIS